MRLTKRQLKRIIREEYSRLKRRGLIREHGGFGARSEMSSEVEYYCEQITEELYHGDEMSYMELEDALAAIMPDFDSAMLGSAIDMCIQRGVIQARFGADGLGVFMISPDYMM